MDCHQNSLEIIIWTDSTSKVVSSIVIRVKVFYTLSVTVMTFANDLGLNLS